MPKEPTEEQKKTMAFLDFFIEYLQEEEEKKKNPVRKITQKVIDLNKPDKKNEN